MQILTVERAMRACEHAMIEIPPLEPHCGSWIVSRKTGEVIGEFYERANVQKFNPATCTVETAAQYLGRINANIRNSKG